MTFNIIPDSITNKRLLTDKTYLYSDGLYNVQAEPLISGVLQSTLLRNKKLCIITKRFNELFCFGVSPVAFNGLTDFHKDFIIFNQGDSVVSFVFLCLRPQQINQNNINFVHEKYIISANYYEVRYNKITGEYLSGVGRGLGLSTYSPRAIESFNPVFLQNFSVYDTTWINTKNYAKGEIITLDNDLYFCLLANTGNAPSNATYWGKINQWYIHSNTSTSVIYRYYQLSGVHGEYIGLKHPPAYGNINLTLSGLTGIWSFFNDVYTIDITNSFTNGVNIVTTIGVNKYTATIIYATNMIKCTLNILSSPNPSVTKVLIYYLPENIYQNGDIYQVNSADAAINNIDELKRYNHFFNLGQSNGELTYYIVDLGGGYFKLQFLLYRSSQIYYLLAETEPYNTAGDVSVYGRMTGTINLKAGALTATVNPVRLQVYKKPLNGIYKLSQVNSIPCGYNGVVGGSYNHDDFPLNSIVTVTGGVDIAAGETWAYTPPSATHAELQALIP